MGCMVAKVSKPAVVLQVVLSGNARHAAPVPATEGGTAVARSADGAVSLAAESQPLRVYHEYLSYLFRKPEPPTAQQQLELGYRDYLQVLFGCAVLPILDLPMLLWNSHVLTTPSRSMVITLLVRINDRGRLIVTMMAPHVHGFKGLASLSRHPCIAAVRLQLRAK